MVQFRRSKKVGPFRFTLSNRGISTSAGAGPLRISRGADGKYRRTVRVPGTGLYDTKVIGGQSHTTSRQRAQLAPDAGWYPDPTGGPGRKYWDGVLWHDAVPATAGTATTGKRGGTTKVVMAVAAVLLGLVAVGKLTESHNTNTGTSRQSSPVSAPASAAPDVVDITARGSAIIPGMQFPPGSTGSASGDGSAEIWQTPLLNSNLTELIRSQLPIAASMGGLAWCSEGRDPVTQQVTWTWGGYPEPTTMVTVIPGRGEVTISRDTNPADTC